MTIADKAALHKTLTNNLAQELQSITPQDMVTVLHHLADAAQYLGAALRAIGDAANAQYKATGLTEWDEVYDAAYNAAALTVSGGLHVEDHVIPAAEEALLADQDAEVLT